LTNLQDKIKLHFKLPTNHNDQTPIPDREWIDVKNYFVELYGGLTVDSPSSGFLEKERHRLSRRNSRVFHFHTKEKL